MTHIKAQLYGGEFIIPTKKAHLYMSHILKEKTYKTYIELEQISEYPELIFVEFGFDSDGVIELYEAHINLWGAEIDLLAYKRDCISKGLKDACMQYLIKHGIK